MWKGQQEAAEEVDFSAILIFISKQMKMRGKCITFPEEAGYLSSQKTKRGAIE